MKLTDFDEDKHVNPNNLIATGTEEPSLRATGLMTESSNAARGAIIPTNEQHRLDT